MGSTIDLANNTSSDPKGRGEVSFDVLAKWAKLRTLTHRISAARHPQFGPQVTTGDVGVNGGLLLVGIGAGQSSGQM